MTVSRRSFLTALLGTALTPVISQIPVSPLETTIESVLEVPNAKILLQWENNPEAIGYNIYIHRQGELYPVLLNRVGPNVHKAEVSLDTGYYYSVRVTEQSLTSSWSDWSDA